VRQTRNLLVTGVRSRAPAASTSEDADPVIELDQRGVELLRALAGTRSQFRVTTAADGSICLHPMSAHDVELWRSGLVNKIVEGFSRPDRMIRLKPDKL
jgi:hypothetical protein